MVEAACNPLVATLYPKEKTKMLNRFHVWFPGGIVIGGVLGFIIMDFMGLSWLTHFIGLRGLTVPHFIGLRGLTVPHFIGLPRCREFLFTVYQSVRRKIPKCPLSLLGSHPSDMGKQAKSQECLSLLGPVTHRGGSTANPVSCGATPLLNKVR